MDDSYDKNICSNGQIEKIFVLACAESYISPVVLVTKAGSNWEGLNRKELKRIKESDQMTLTVFSWLQRLKEEFWPRIQKGGEGAGLFGIKRSKITPARPNFFWPPIKAVMPTLEKLTPVALNLKLLCHGSFKRSL